MNFLLNWKTTVLGIGAIAGGIAALCNTLATGHFDLTVITTDLGLISGGIMGLFAKDKNVTGAGDSAVAK